jgi:ABC-2 type transport system ATP-binding protein
MLAHPIPAKRLIGYLPESAPAYTDMTVHGFLNFAAEIRGLTGAARKQAVHRVVEMCFLEAVLHQSVETLSKGYRHRTCFAQSIIHDPDVLVLDEPTDGLDPNQKHEVRNLIRRMGEKKAIIFSTHILEEVDAVCSRAIIIDRGRVVANGTPAELRQKSDLAGAVTVRVAGVAASAISQKLQGVAAVKRCIVVSENGKSATVRAFPKAPPVNGEFARAIGEALNGVKIEELHTEEGRLDEVFRSITMPDTAKEVAR